MFLRTDENRHFQENPLYVISKIHVNSKNIFKKNILMLPNVTDV